MKKALKTIFIVILCLAVAGGTGYLFFLNMSKSVSAFENVNSFTSDINQKEFNLDMQKVALTGGSRFNLMITSYQDMIEITYSLNSYLIGYHNASAETKIVEKLSTLSSTQNTVKTMAEEYFVKCNSEAYNKVVGANDLYESFAHYIAECAEFNQYVQDKIKAEISTYSTDVKFSVFDVYANVVKLSLKNLKVSDNADLSNLKFMQSHFALKDNYLSTNNANGNFAIENNKFITAYNKCDKTSFATNLTNNLANATDTATSEELVATHYLKVIFGA